MIDNYDSFTYNLVAYFEEEGVFVDVVRNDMIDLAHIQRLVNSGELLGIIISPGPKNPSDCGRCREIVGQFHQQVPIFGICLGHQIMAYVFGADIIKGDHPVHGKVDALHHNGWGIFKGLPTPFHVTRYHSLIVEKDSLSMDFKIDALSDDDVIMAISHRQYPLFGVQFHPEAVLTEYGHEMIRNFIQLSLQWREYGNLC